LDGVDPGSASPVERLKFVVYQRRLLLEAMKNKAMLQAMCGQAEAAAKTATSYIKMAIPVSRLIEAQRERDMDKQLKEIEEMGPGSMRPA
jgi:hypothetical protein